MSIFWLNDPSILLQIHSLHDFWPEESMSKNEKFNAITRLLLLIILFFYISNRSIKFVCIGLTTLVMITIVYYIQEKDTETFTNLDTCNSSTKLQKPTTENPMANVLLPEIKDDPERPAAAFTYGNASTTKVEESVKDMTCKVSFKDEDADEMKRKLFSNVGDQYNLDRSLIQFYTTSSTDIPNDRENYQQWLYGNMPSCKDQDPIACLKNSFRHIPD